MSVSSLLLLCFSAVFAENLVFTRLLGVGPLITVSGKPKAALTVGALITAVMTLSSALAFAARRFVLEPLGAQFLQIIVYVVIIVLLSEGAGLLLSRFLPALYGIVSVYMPLVPANCAVLGASLLSVQFGHGFVQSVLFGFFGSLGFALALFVFCGVRERLELADPPRSFAGVPMYLVALGLIALAFCGFKGVDFGGGSLFPFTLS